MNQISRFLISKRMPVIQSSPNQYPELQVACPKGYAFSLAFPHVQVLKPCEGRPPFWPDLHQAELDALVAVAETLASPWHIAWFPSFGCALLAFSALPPKAERPEDAASSSCTGLDVRPCLGEASLFVLGLDDFRFRTHCR